MRDVIERCKLPQAIELKKLGYNHNDIMVQEEKPIAEKILKLFPDENIVLNNNFNGRSPHISFKDYIVPLKLMREIMKIMTQAMNKKEKTCLKSIILKLFDVVTMILTLIFINLQAK